MAIITTKQVVCDEGREKCDNSLLLKVQLSVDGRRVAKLYCREHAAPFQKLLEEMGGAPVRRGRGKIYTPEEIKAQRRPTTRKKS